MNILDAIILLVILLFSAILHEIAHGLVAERFGDPTARLMGRLTLNPKVHIDLFMSILLPLLLLLSGSPVVFGAAKPVPVDEFNLRDGRRDLALVALAGPLTNLLIAIVFAAIIKLLIVSHIFNPGTFLLLSILQKIVSLNLLLAIFNLLPIPPLDGSKIFAMLLPEQNARAYLSLGSVGFIIIFVLLAFPIGGFSLQFILAKLLTLAESALGL